MKAGASKYHWRWIAVVAVLVLYGLNYVFTPDIVGITKLEVFFRPRGELQFDSDKWKKTPPGGGERYKMVDDLLSKQLLLDRSPEEIKSLLGEPDIAALEDGEPAMYYMLGSQKDYPSRSLLFPGGLGNLENWTLAVRFRNGRAYLTTVKVD